MVLTDFERKVLAEISKEGLWRHVEWFASQGEKHRVRRLGGGNVYRKTRS